MIVFTRASTATHDYGCLHAHQYWLIGAAVFEKRNQHFDRVDKSKQRVPSMSLYGIKRIVLE
jgi:hypothetical protein